MIQPCTTVTTPANILFNRYLNQIDNTPLEYNRYGFYRVDSSVDRATILETLKDLGFSITFEFVEGRKGLAGAILAQAEIESEGMGGPDLAYLYSHFNTNNHLILYLSGRVRLQTKVDALWGQILNEFPEAEDD